MAGEIKGTGKGKGGPSEDGSALLGHEGAVLCKVRNTEKEEG